MDGTLIGAIIGGSVLAIVNIAAIAYSYGKLTSKVEALCNRIERLERVHNNLKEGT